MKTRMMRKIAVLVTGSALALSFPVAGSFADPPGNGNDNHHCGTSARQWQWPEAQLSPTGPQQQRQGLEVWLGQVTTDR